ncbi:hypothetical protein N9L66_00470 [Porticoccaceae bacterium]|nr:hypothetical protein [Porticoccaceae bacterium]
MFIDNTNIQTKKIVVTVMLSAFMGIMIGCTKGDQHTQSGLNPSKSEDIVLSLEEVALLEKDDEINRHFVKMSHLIKDNPNEKLVSVEVSPSQTYRGIIKNSLTGETRNLFAIRGGFYISGEMYDSSGMLVGEKEDAVDNAEKSPLINDLALARTREDTSTSIEDPAERAQKKSQIEIQKDPSPTIQPNEAIKHNPHLEFFGTLANKATIEEKQRYLLNYGYELNGATVNPGGKLKMVIFYDPFCPHCHNLYKKLKANADFAQRWVPISMGLDQRARHLGGMIALAGKANNQKAIQIMDHVMGSNLIPALAPEGKERLEAISDLNTQFILPILIQEKAGTPYSFIETAGGGTEFFEGVPSLLQIKNWAAGNRAK